MSENQNAIVDVNNYEAVIPVSRETKEMFESFKQFIIDGEKLNSAFKVDTSNDALIATMIRAIMEWFPTEKVDEEETKDEKDN